MRRRTVEFFTSHSGASAVEFAILLAPFLMLLLGALQMGVYYYAQVSLDAGVLKTAEALYTNFHTGTSTPTMPPAATLKTNIKTYGGSMSLIGANLKVEIRQLTSLTAGAVAITDGTVDYGSANSILALRAESSFTTFVPGLGSLATVRSSALVRRQGR